MSSSIRSDVYYRFQINNVRFQGSGIWPYSVHTRRSGSKNSNLFRWQGLWCFSTLAGVKQAFKRACEACPNSDVYLINHRMREIVEMRERTHADPVPEPTGVDE